MRVVVRSLPQCKPPNLSRGIAHIRDGGYHKPATAMHKSQGKDLGFAPSHTASLFTLSGGTHGYGTMTAADSFLVFACLQEGASQTGSQPFDNSRCYWGL